MSETCPTCRGTGWLCAANDRPADFENGTCCHPEHGEFALGPGCPSANGCPDCTRAGDGFATYEEREIPEHFMRGEDGYARFMAWEAGERG